MIANVSIWLRAFRLPLQRAYPRIAGAGESVEADLADLLRAADERLAACALPPEKSDDGGRR